MSASPAQVPPPVVVSRLRAAGCVFAEDEARLLVSAARTPAELEAMVDRRVGGVPLEYVIGWAEFCGLRITVAPGVFVPRRRTELLVDEATRVLRPLAAERDRVAAPVVIDLCCGSGAVGAALLATIGRMDVHAVDIEPVAVRCARRNLADSGAQVYEGDLYAPLPERLRGRVDVIVANAPYVPSASIRLLPPEARLHEPSTALDGGADGLDVQRRVAEDAAGWLAPGGHLLIETSEQQASETFAVVTRGGFVARVVHSEEQGGTVVVGTRDLESIAGLRPVSAPMR